MRTKALILTAALLGVTCGPARASEQPSIERIDGRGVEILTGSARVTERGLRVSGLIRRDRVGGALPVAAHLDISAFDREGRLLATTSARIPALTASLRHRHPGRYEAILPAQVVAGGAKIQVRYHARAHAAEGGEGVQ